MKKLILAALMFGLSSIAWAATPAESDLSKATAKMVNVAADAAVDAKGKLAEYSSVLTELTKEYAPQAVDAGLMVVKLTGLQNLLIGGVCLIIATILWALYFTKWWKHTNTFRITSYDDYPTQGKAFGALTLGLTTSPLIIAVFNTLGHIWNWVAVFEPKLYIAYRLFHKLL